MIRQQWPPRRQSQESNEDRDEVTGVSDQEVPGDQQVSNSAA